MNKEWELQKQINEIERKYEKNKFKRNIITIIIATIVFFFIGKALFSIDNIVECIILAFVCAIIYFFVSALAFTYLFTKSESENNHIKYLEDELRKIREQSTK